MAFPHESQSPICSPATPTGSPYGLAGGGEGRMNDADRFKLRFGPYRTRRFRVGQVVRYEVRGMVRIVGLSEAPIPWPSAMPASGSSESSQPASSSPLDAGGN